MNFWWIFAHGAVIWLTTSEEIESLYIAFKCDFFFLIFLSYLIEVEMSDPKC